jgi:hypothetical protein
MQPVVVAILIDSFISASANWKLQQLKDDENLWLVEKGLSKAVLDSPLSPLLYELCNFLNEVFLPVTTFKYFVLVSRNDSRSVFFLNFILIQSDLIARIKALFYVSIKLDDIFLQILKV